MTEAFSHREGALYMWTGSAAASGSPVGFVNNVSVSFQYSWQNQLSIGTARYEWLNDARADVMIGTLWTNTSRVYELAHQTGQVVHIKLEASGVNGSGGWLVYSGQIDSVQVLSQQGGVDMLSMMGHGFEWTGY